MIELKDCDQLLLVVIDLNILNRKTAVKFGGNIEIMI